MTPDILTWVSQNIGPITFGISGTAAVSASAFGYLIYRRKHELEQVDLRSVVSGWRERDIARLFGVLEGIPVRGTDEAALLDAIERRLSSSTSRRRWRWRKATSPSRAHCRWRNARNSSDGARM